MSLAILDFAWDVPASACERDEERGKACTASHRAVAEGMDEQGRVGEEYPERAGGKAVYGARHRRD